MIQGGKWLLIQTLRQPAKAADYDLAQWDLLIRQARHASLLARLAELTEEEGIAVPVEAELHLAAARCLARKQAQVVHYEVGRIVVALEKTQAPVILLKGAAYMMAGLPPARGRLFSDVDILVPWAKLDEVERSMMLHGWVGGHHDAYDQHYYRTWSHELPPLKHVQRRTVVDVHHTILPPTVSLKPDAAKLIAAALPLPGYERLYILSPADMVLHSATHLFHEGELENGLRDLVDLDALLRHFGAREGFWEQLVERAGEMDLLRPLYYALRYSRRFLATPVPDLALKGAGLGRPRQPGGWYMDRLFNRALMPDHASCDDFLTGPARFLLYVRSHYLRMPLYMLIPHLVRKALKRRKQSVPLGGRPLEIDRQG